MVTATAGATEKRPDLFRTISTTTLLTGFLNLAAGLVKYFLDNRAASGLNLPGPLPVNNFSDFLAHGGPVYFFKHIASAVFGRDPSITEALQVTWGIVFHFMVAFLLTAFLFIIYPATVRILRFRILAAIFFGLLCWYIMYFLVLPLTEIPREPFEWRNAAIDMLILVTFLGWPVAHYGSRHLRKISSTY